MTDFHDLRTEGFATRAPEGSEPLIENSREQLKGNVTVTSMNDAKKRRGLRYRDQIHDKNTRGTILVPTAARRKGSSKNKHSSLVIQVRRIYSEKMVFVETKVDIKGKLLLEELKSIHGDTRGVFLGDALDTVKPELLYWSRIDILKRKQALQNEDSSATQEAVITELDVALKFIHEEYGDLIPSVERLLEENKMTFNNLWTILAPNTLIYSKDELGNDRIHRLESSGITQDRNGSYFLSIIATHIDSDGVRLGIVYEGLKIPQFEGALPIGELPVYPVQYHTDREGLHARLLRRGNIQLVFHGDGHRLREHEGYGMRVGSKSVVKFKTHGRVIIDAATYVELEPELSMVPEVKEAMQSEPSEKFQVIAFGHVLSEKKEKEKSKLEEPSSRGSRLLSNAETRPSSGYAPRPSTYERLGRYSYGTRSKYSNVSTAGHRRTQDRYDHSFEDVPDDEHTSEARTFYRKEDMTDTLKVMLSGKVYGFSLGDSTWGTFSVSRVEKPDWNPDVWGQLVMDTRQKELLESLIRSHGREQSGFDDIIKGKGKGLVGLLLGPPGVGKTLTAEAVAEISRLPLFVMSCGGLGSHANEINKSLKEYLELATRWNAVLLLDEADTYLAKRNDNDLERNAIISVFLREIEYYTGIMILTTNRAQSIDPAFQSRIHFCHHYHRHNTSTRKKIWKTFVENSKKNPNIHVDIGEDGFEKLATLKLNGREIKNAMSLAVSLAANDTVDKGLRAERIISITKLLQNFNSIDEDEPEDKEEEHIDDEISLKVQIDLPCQGMTQGVPERGRAHRPRKLGIPKLEKRNQSTVSSNADIANGG